MKKQTPSSQDLCLRLGAGQQDLGQLHTLPRRPTPDTGASGEEQTLGSWGSECTEGHGGNLGRRRMSGASHSWN